MTNTTKAIHMVKRFKSHFSHLSIFLPKMKKTTNTICNTEQTVLSFSNDEVVLDFVFSKMTDPTDAYTQFMHIVFNSKNNDNQQLNRFVSDSMSVDEAKKTINELLSYLAGISILIDNPEHITNISLSRIKRFLFLKDYSKEDTDTFIALFNEEYNKIRDKKETQKECNDHYNSAKNKYDFEFKSRSRQKEINSLKETLARMEREEEKLKEELTKKHKIHHLENINNGKQKESHGDYSKAINTGARIISENNLFIDYKVMEELLNIKLT